MTCENYRNVTHQKRPFSLQFSIDEDTKYTDDSVLQENHNDA